MIKPKKVNSESKPEAAVQVAYLNNVLIGSNSNAFFPQSSQEIPDTSRKRKREENYIDSLTAKCTRSGRRYG
jgi:hypothetical protein